MASRREHKLYPFYYSIYSKKREGKKTCVNQNKTSSGIACGMEEVRNRDREREIEYFNTIM